MNRLCSCSCRKSLATRLDIRRKSPVSTGISNVVIRRNGTLVTPPVACGLLAGTFRESLLKAGEIEESVISLAELKAAREIFLINSVRKWQKAVWK